MSATPSNGISRKETISPPIMYTFPNPPTIFARTVSQNEWESLPMSSNADAKYVHNLRGV